MLHSERDRSEVAVVLLKQRALFAFGLLRVEWHLILHALGSSSVTGYNLVNSLELLRL